MDSLQTRLRSQLDLTPDRRALCFYERGVAPAWKSFREVYETAAACADRLAAEGLGPGDRCVLVLPSNEACSTALLAVLLRGAVPLLAAPPVLQSGSHSSLLENLERVLHTAAPKLVLSAPHNDGFAEALRAAEPSVRVSNDVWGETTPSEISCESPSGRDVAALQLTSGTTGASRVCVWSQERVLAALDGMTAAMELDASDVCFNWTPLYHDMGLTNNFLLCLTAGIPLAMLSPHDFVKRPALWLEGLQATGATVTWSPNFGYALAARKAKFTEPESLDLSKVRAFWNAAERIHFETAVEFHQRFEPNGVRWSSLKTNFGCAENVGGATFSDPRGEMVVDWVDRRSLYESGSAQPATEDSPDRIAIVSAGRPYPGLTVEILDENGMPLPDGEVGEVALTTPSSMTGYLGEPEETDRVLDSGRLFTGDLGYTRRGELFWTGRVRERINTRGKKFDPSDFESCLHAIDGLRTGCFAAFGVDDTKSGTQRIVVVAELAVSLGRSSSELSHAIQRAVFEELGVLVSDVVLLPNGSMTKTSSGKRRHRHYRGLYLAGQLEPLRTKAS